MCDWSAVGTLLFGARSVIARLLSIDYVYTASLLTEVFLISSAVQRGSHEIQFRQRMAQSLFNRRVPGTQGTRRALVVFNLPTM